MAWKGCTVAVALLLALLVCAAASGDQSEAVVEEVSLPITVERAVGSLAIIAEFSGTLLLDCVEIAMLNAGEEVTLGNVQVGQRLVEIRGTSTSVTFLADVKKDQETAVRISETDAPSYVTGGELSTLRSLRSLGGGVYIYDMEEPIFVVDTAFSYYLDDEYAVGGFIGFDKYFGLGRGGLQTTFGDSRTFAAGIRVGYFFPDSVSLVGICLYLKSAYFSLDYSFPDGCWAGEIHILFGYSLRL